jgi:hypothetical protein
VALDSHFFLKKILEHQKKNMIVVLWFWLCVLNLDFYNVQVNMTKDEVLAWPLPRINLFDWKNWSQLKSWKKRRQKNYIAQVQLHTSRIKSLFGILLLSWRFDNSTNVPHDAHVLGAKHHVLFFYIHLKWIHQLQLHIPIHMPRATWSKWSTWLSKWKG